MPKIPSKGGLSYEEMEREAHDRYEVFIKRKRSRTYVESVMLAFVNIMIVNYYKKLANVHMNLFSTGISGRVSRPHLKIYINRLETDLARNYDGSNLRKQLEKATFNLGV